MQIDISKKKSGKIVTRVGDKTKEVLEKRHVTYKEKELTIEYMIENMRYVEIRECKHILVLNINKRK